MCKPNYPWDWNFIVLDILGVNVPTPIFRGTQCQPIGQVVNLNFLFANGNQYAVETLQYPIYKIFDWFLWHGITYEHGIVIDSLWGFGTIKIQIGRPCTHTIVSNLHGITRS